MAILNDNEFVEIEGRAYVNPQTALDESNAFIENLRNTQQANNQQIQTDTYNLGTAVPSNLGGLTSPTGDTGLSYFTSRYQTPQTNAVVENLRAVAQASALNQALENEQAIWKNRYQQAYRNYQKKQYDRAYGGGGGNGNNPTDEANKGDVETIVTPGRSSYTSSIKGVDNQYNFVDAVGNLHLIDMTTGEETIIEPDYSESGSNGQGFSGGGSGGGSVGGR